jgi:hypothetical protein
VTPESAGAVCLPGIALQPGSAARVYIFGAQISFPHGMTASGVKSSDAGHCEGLITSDVQYCNPTKSLSSDLCVALNKGRRLRFCVLMENQNHRLVGVDSDVGIGNAEICLVTANSFSKQKIR